LEFVGAFMDRREELESAITTHTIVGVDEASIKLNMVNERTAELKQKYVS